MSQALSPLGNRILNIVVCLGASIVIVGALFKIQHAPGSDIMLPVGLLVEAGIFVIYAILPPDDDHAAPAPVHVTVATPNVPHEDPAAPHHQYAQQSPVEKKKDIGAGIEKLDTALKEGIDVDSFSRLGASFKKLEDTVSQATDIANAVNVSKSFASKASDAANALENVTQTVQQANDSLVGLGNSASSSKQLQEQLQTMANNLSLLNKKYEMELSDNGGQTYSISAFYNNLSQVAISMQDSAEDVVRAKEQIALLVNNLGRLNHVYGNMLTAIQGR